jgi:AcrR family transcriptional regulator
MTSDEDTRRKLERSARRAVRRRREIIEAALTVFERVGFEVATTRLIAQEADVSEGTIYNYFPDKGELYIQALKETSALAVLVFELGRGDAPLAAVLEEVAAWRAAHQPQQAALVELWAQVMSRPSLRARYHELVWVPAAQSLEAAIARAREAGEVFAAPPALAARILMSGLLGLTLMSLADPLLAGILAPGGEGEGVDVRGILWRGLRLDREGP